MTASPLPGYETANIGLHVFYVAKVDPNSTVEMLFYLYLKNKDV